MKNDFYPGPQNQLSKILGIEEKKARLNKIYQIYFKFVPTILEGVKKM